MAKHGKHKGKSSLPSKRKAGTILHHGTVRGKALTGKQRRLMGHLASGGKGTRVRRKGK